MVKLDRSDIRTKEVLDWKGLHLLNFSQSACSQKVRILLAEKRLTYRSIEVDLTKAENATPWFLGINPRGVVPALAHDGDVHVESNDILRYIDEAFPSSGRSWIPEGANEARIADELLAREDGLHMHLRAVTMGFLAPRAIARKSDAELKAYARNGPDDAHRAEQVAWWRAFAKDGVTAQQARDAVIAFHGAFARLAELLADKEWLLGDQPTVLDIAWFISLNRVIQAGYPIETRPSLYRLFRRMKARRAFAREVNRGPASIRFLGPLYRGWRRAQGSTLSSVHTDIEFGSMAAQGTANGEMDAAGQSTGVVGHPRRL